MLTSTDKNALFRREKSMDSPVADETITLMRRESQQLKKVNWKFKSKKTGWLKMKEDNSRSSSPSTEKSMSRSASAGGTHIFISHTFIRPSKCSHCSEKVWGQEYKCQVCDYVSHSKCIKLVPRNCTAEEIEHANAVPNGIFFPHITVLSKGGIVSSFGRELKEQLTIERRDIPKIVENCVAAVEQRGFPLPLLSVLLRED